MRDARPAPPMLLASGLSSIASGTILLLLPIDGLALGGLAGGFALPGMMSLGAATTSIPGAMAVARAGHKPVMLGGLVLSALSITLVARGESTLQLGLAALGYGLGQGMYGFARIAYLSDAIAREQRGRVVSAVGGMGRAGMLIGPFAGGLTAAELGRDNALLGAAVALAAAAIVVALRLPARSTVPASRSRNNPVKLVARVLGEHPRTFATAGISMLALAMVRNARMLLIPICGTVLGLDEGEVGLIKSLSMGADLLLFYPAGVVMDRFGRKWTAVPCLTGLSLGVVIVGHAESYSMLLAGGLVAGFGNGLGSGINMTLAGDMSPRVGRADFLGVWSLLTDSGAALAPFAMAAVAQALAVAGASVLVCGVGVCGALVMAIGVREPLRGDRRGAARSR